MLSLRNGKNFSIKQPNVLENIYPNPLKRQITMLLLALTLLERFIPESVFRRCKYRRTKVTYQQLIRSTRSGALQLYENEPLLHLCPKLKSCGILKTLLVFSFIDRDFPQMHYFFATRSLTSFVPQPSELSEEVLLN